MSESEKPKVSWLQILVGIALIAYGVFVFQSLFNWFVAGCFGLKELSYAAAFGVMLCYKCLSAKYGYNLPKYDVNTSLKSCAKGYTFFLVFGYFVSQFV